eukprot:UN00795
MIGFNSIYFAENLYFGVQTKQTYINKNPFNMISQYSLIYTLRITV